MRSQVSVIYQSIWSQISVSKNKGDHKLDVNTNKRDHEWHKSPQQFDVFTNKK